MYCNLFVLGTLSNPIGQSIEDYARVVSKCGTVFFEWNPVQSDTLHLNWSVLGVIINNWFEFFILTIIYNIENIKVIIN